MPKDFLLLLRRPPLMAFGVFAAAALVAFAIIWKMDRAEQQALRADAENFAQNHVFLVRDSLDQALALNFGMASMLRIEKGNTDHFESYAREILPFYTSVSHLSLSPGGIITHVYPLEGNERSLGFNQLQNSAQTLEATRALESGKLSLAGPLELIQGGLGVVVRLPVFLDDDMDAPRFWGFTNVTIRISQLLKTANLTQLDSQGFAYKLWRIDPSTQTEQIIASHALEFLQNPVEKSMKVPNGVWTLSLAPVKGWQSITGLAWKVALGALICFLLAYQSALMIYLLRRKIRLEAAVTLQTHEVNSAKAELQATLDAMPDLLFDVDGEGCIHSYHTNQPDLLSVLPEAFLGRKFYEFLPAAATDSVFAALREAEKKGTAHGFTYEVSVKGKRKVFELSVSRKRTEDVGVSRFVVLSRDITERRQSEEDLRIAATAFEASEGMLITDPAGIILRVNKAFVEITGFTAEDVVGKSPSILKSGRHDAQFYRDMWDLITKTGSWQGEVWNRRRCGEVFPEWLTITAVKNDYKKITHYVSTLTDITDRKADEERINRLAFFDPLTQLPNRSLLRDRLTQSITSCQRQNTKGALLFIDLDDFKTLNDSRGHHIGDLLLIAVAGRLRESVRSEDTVARLGGDEFLVVLDGLSESSEEAANQAQQVGEKILQELNVAYHLEGQDYFNTPSIGICLFSDEQRNIDELLKQADQAMYHAKASGRNTLRFFDPAMQALTAQRFALQSEMRDALHGHQFQLFYQPQVNHKGKVLGAEALIRWHHPERGVVSPIEFIPLAEESGLILLLGEWILMTACEQLLAWAKNPISASWLLSVNVSARQFKHPDFVAQVLQVIERTGINPQRLILELTESMLVDDQQEIITKMSALKMYGIQFSLDDFGTGYSSLSYLKRLPINELKIDKSFVDEVLTDANDAAIAVMIIRLAQSMDLTVVAEGVETLEQRDWLAEQGCYHYQGYYFSRPIPIDSFNAQFLAEPIA